MLAGLVLASCAPVVRRSPSAGSPQRIVSLYPQQDALLLAVADQGQIAGLSLYAHDPVLSADLTASAGLPAIPERAEAILARDPDLVLTSRFTPAATRAALARLGVRTAAVESATTAAESLAQLRQVATLVGHPERGEVLAGWLEQRLAAAAPPANLEPIPALVFQANGYAAGTGTLIDDLLHRAGFANAARRYGVGDWGGVPLERIVIDPPRVLFAGAPQPGAPSFAERVLRHPALLALKDRMLIADLPERLLLNGGPLMAQTLDRLVAARRRVEGA